jgi:prepilin-type N-terminal cleavage/methylation domain-containing protein
MVTSQLTGRAMRSRLGFTLIELLIVVVIIGILAAIAVPKFANSKEKAYVSRMKGDLRNLVTAQEGYVADNLAYYSGPLPSPTMAYNPSPNVVITITFVGPAGWAATAAMPTITPRTCAVFYGTVAAPPAPATAEGAVACT